MRIRPFLSHKRQDALVVSRLKRTLQLYGAGGWKDTDDLRMGASTEVEIRRAISEDTAGFIWWGTQRALSSEIINQLEIPTALERARAEPFYPFVPVFVNLSPGKNRTEIDKAIGQHAHDLLDRNGIVRSKSEASGAFRQRIARRYVRDAVQSLARDPTTVAFRVLSEPSGDHELTFDWRSVLDERSRRLAPGSILTLLDALANTREAFQGSFESPRLRLDLDLPLPLALLVGYEWRITTRLRLELRQRTGSSFAWINTEGPLAGAPTPVEDRLGRGGPTVVAVSCKDSLENAAYRYAKGVSASELIIIHVPGLIDGSQMRALARASANKLRELNDRGVEKHLLVRGPASLAAMIGAASNACGPTTAPFWDGQRYTSPVVVGS